MPLPYRRSLVIEDTAELTAFLSGYLGITVRPAKGRRPNVRVIEGPYDRRSVIDAALERFGKKNTEADR